MSFPLHEFRLLLQACFAFKQTDLSLLERHFFTKTSFPREHFLYCTSPTAESHLILAGGSSLQRKVLIFKHLIICDFSCIFNMVFFNEDFSSAKLKQPPSKKHCIQRLIESLSKKLERGGCLPSFQGAVFPDHPRTIEHVFGRIFWMPRA